VAVADLETARDAYKAAILASDWAAASAQAAIYQVEFYAIPEASIDSSKVKYPDPSRLFEGIEKAKEAATRSSGRRMVSTRPAYRGC